MFGYTKGGFCECGGAWNVGTTSFSLIDFLVNGSSWFSGWIVVL